MPFNLPLSIYPCHANPSSSRSGNIEGKPLEQLVYLGGLVNYERKAFGVLGKGSDEWAGFDIVRNDSTKEHTAESVKSHGAVHTEYLPIGAA